MNNNNLNSELNNRAPQEPYIETNNPNLGIPRPNLAAKRSLSGNFEKLKSKNSATEPGQTEQETGRN